MTDFGFLAENINFHHAEYERHQRKAIEHAVACGERLAEVKRQVGHGNWIAWVRANCDFKHHTATNYIRIAKNWQDVANLDLDTVTGVLAELATPKPKQEANPFRWEKRDPWRDITPGKQAWMVPWSAWCPRCKSVEVYPKPLPGPAAWSSRGYRHTVLDIALNDWDIQDLIADHRRGLITTEELYDRAL